MLRIVTSKRIQDAGNIAEGWSTIFLRGMGSWTVSKNNSCRTNTAKKIVQREPWEKYIEEEELFANRSHDSL